MSAKSTGRHAGRASGQNQARRTPRKGQAELLKIVADNPQRKMFAAKLPGGYGKTGAIGLVYDHARQTRGVTRLLVVVANDAQREQLHNDFHSDCAAFGIVIRAKPWVVDRDAVTVRANVEHKAEVFVATIQQVSASARGAGIDPLAQLLRSAGVWMLAADEFHHYGAGRDWGNALQHLVDLAALSLALSATPMRDGPDTIFGRKLDVDVTYEDGREESALKKLVCQRFHYQVEYLDESNNVVRYTTDQLREEIMKDCDGNIVPVDTWEQRRKLRQTSKYIHPLLRDPVFRLLEKRLKGGGAKLQMLVRAFSRAHAIALCEQIEIMVRDAGLTVDWVSTMRKSEENRAILARFCPPKGGDGKRPEPSLDILVQVGMVGEGNDTINVAEIIDLGIVTLRGNANQTKQFFLRASRWIPGAPDAAQVAHINVPSDHPLANEADIEGWIDSNADVPPPKGETDGGKEPPELQPIGLRAALEEINAARLEVELLGVSLAGDPFFNEWFNLVREKQATQNRPRWSANDPEDMAVAETMYMGVLTRRAAAQDEQLRIRRRKEAVNSAVAALANHVIRMTYRTQVAPTEKSLFVDVIRRLNSHLKRKFGERDALMADELDSLADEIDAIDSAVRAGQTPLWLV